MRKSVFAMFVIVATAFAGVVAAAPAALAVLPPVLHVSKSGTNVGGCVSLPCLTIAYAAGQASAGATILVAAGTYTEQVNITKPVSLVGAGASTTVIDGTGLTLTCPQCALLNIGDGSPTWSGPVNVTGITLQNPTFESTGTSNAAVDVWIQSGPTAVNLHSDTFRGNGVALASSFGVFTQTLGTPVNVSNSTFTGLWLGVFSEDGGAGSFTGNTFTSLIPLSVDHAPAGIFVLSDSGQTMAGQTVSQNTFTDYAGFGVVLMAHYYLSDNSTSIGSIASSTVTANTFNLGASTDPLAAAIGLWADGGSTPQSDLTATISHNSGTVVAPTQTIEQVGGTPTGLHLTLSDNTFNASHTTLRLATDPPGLKLTVDGSQVTTPFTDTVIVDSRVSVSAALFEEVGTTPYVFAGWSDGGSVNHDVVVAGPQSLTARYVHAGDWMASQDGSVFAFGSDKFAGSMQGAHVNKPIVDITSTKSGNGYWLVASDGGVFSFGDATFHGSTGAMSLNRPIVAMAPTPSGNGYWLVASDGGVFSFGDATFHGSTGAMSLNRPIVGMASTPSGDGYSLVASDGGIFSFGDAHFDGSLGGRQLNAPVVGMRTTGTGDGYSLVTSDGGTFTFGDAHFNGSLPASQLTAPIVDIA